MARREPRARLAEASGSPQARIYTVFEVIFNKLKSTVFLVIFIKIFL